MSSNNYSLAADSVQWSEYRFHQHLRWLDQLNRYAKPRNRQGQHTAFGKQVEHIACNLLADQGYTTHLTTHKCPWDMWVEGVKVEVKASHWKAKQDGGGRYQACIRNHRAHLYLLACVDDQHKIGGWFVIPGYAIRDRAAIAITHPDPGQYQGQWAEFYNRWDILEEMVSQAGAYPQQLELWQ